MSYCSDGSIWSSFLFGHAWSICPLFFSRSLFLHAARILSSSSSVLLFCSHSICSSLPWGNFYLILRSSVAAVTPGHPNQISVPCVCRGAEARMWQFCCCRNKELHCSGISSFVVWFRSLYVTHCRTSTVFITASTSVASSNIVQPKPSFRIGVNSHIAISNCEGLDAEEAQLAKPSSNYCVWLFR